MGWPRIVDDKPQAACYIGVVILCNSGGQNLTPPQAAGHPAASGIADEKRLTLEVLTSIKRAGADIIISYHALSAARWLREE